MRTEILHLIELSTEMIEKMTHVTGLYLEVTILVFLHQPEQGLETENKSTYRKIKKITLYRPVF